MTETKGKPKDDKLPRDPREIDEKKINNPVPGDGDRPQPGG